MTCPSAFTGQPVSTTSTSVRSWAIMFGSCIICCACPKLPQALSLSSMSQSCPHVLSLFSRPPAVSIHCKSAACPLKRFRPAASCRDCSSSGADRCVFRPSVKCQTEISQTHQSKMSKKYSRYLKICKKYQKITSVKIACCIIGLLAKPAGSPPGMPPGKPPGKPPGMPPAGPTSKKGWQNWKPKENRA